LNRWGIKKDNIYYLTKFYTLKNNGDTVPELTSKFCQLYHRILYIVKLSESAAMVAYAAAFESEYSVHLIERKSADLDAMFNDAEDMGLKNTTQDQIWPPEIWEYPYKKRGKEPKVPSASKDPSSITLASRLSL